MPGWQDKALYGGQVARDRRRTRRGHMFEADEGSVNGRIKPPITMRTRNGTEMMV